jgi:surfeit locus 1 family protein
MRNLLGFKLVPTLFVAATLTLLLSLSFWQFQRLYWKQEIIAQIKHQSQMNAIDLPQYVALPEMLYRKVIAKGEFLHQHEIHIYGGSRKFKGEVGYYILTPLRLLDGKLVIVNRGWVPDKLKDSLTRPATLVKGVIEVSGTIMKNEEKGIYIHDNQPARNLWFYINLDEIRSFLKLPSDNFFENFYILAKLDDNPNIMPYGRDLELSIRNHHLGYALTWLFCAISLMVIYVIYQRKN